MDGFLENDAYHDGYQARQQGKPLDNLSRSMANKSYYEQWRTGWFDADHDIIHTNKDKV